MTTNKSRKIVMTNRYLSITLILLGTGVYGQKMYGGQPKTDIPTFSIALSASEDTASPYYYKHVETRLNQLDTSVTAEQIISYTRYKVLTARIDPRVLDELAEKLYQLNEEKKFTEAINKAKALLLLSPNNISGHKEISLAYKKIGKDRLSGLHFAMMVKVITSVFKYGDGSYEYPYLINNFFEGISIYEAAFRCKPNKTVLMLDKRERLLGAYNGYSSSLDEILIRYANLTHWKARLKKEDYIKEED